MVVPMCGIIGYVGKQNAVPILLDGLKSLNTGVMIQQALQFTRQMEFNVFVVLGSKKSC